MKTIAEIKAALPGFRYADYVRHLAELEAEPPEGPALRVAILRSYTVEAIQPVLKLRFMLDGLRPTFWVGGYNRYVQDVLAPEGGVQDFRPELALLFIRIDEVMPDLIDQYPTTTPAVWEERVIAKARDLGMLVDQIQQASPCQVIVQNMLPPARGYFGAYDPQTPGGQPYIVQQFNRALAAELSARPGAFVWDFDGFVRAIGYDALSDPKMWYVSRNPYKQSAYPALVDDLMRYVRSALGRVKKCVVVDLDNTLWGGVLGEDGIEGIELGRTYPGNCYRAFQQELLRLYDRGILLAINSKNNEADALTAIDQHPDMVLRRRHFAAYRINWRDKATNLRDLSRELNVGLQSFVFIDDNPAECALIRQECPECEVVLLPEKAYLLPGVPSRMWGVENVSLTDEDRKKGALYGARAARREHEQQYTNLDDFLRSLNIEVEIEPAVPFSVPRIAQLTQKTNQMNMTTRRYTEPQIQAMAADATRAVFSVSSRDRFGADGIIGVGILAFESDECRIDTFLLSCRVIGRGIEQLTVAFMADFARRRGARALIGEFIPTAKNQPAAGLYEGMGFERIEETLFRIDLQTASLSYPPHIHFVVSDTASRD